MQREADPGGELPRLRSDSTPVGTDVACVMHARVLSQRDSRHEESVVISA